MGDIRIRLFFLILCSWLMPVSLAAKESAGLETQIKAGLGFEYWQYEERLPENFLASSSDASNLVFKVEGLKRSQQLFIGIRAILPVETGDSRETWTVNAIPDQTDKLTYSLYQLSFLTGYAFTPLFNPFLGLDTTWSRQQRSDFRDRSGMVISAAEITEDVSAFYLSAGFKGFMALASNWEASYGVQYRFPFYSRVENNGLPGWEATNMDGYSWDVFAELIYRVKDNMSIKLDVSTGRLHWAGSGWQTYDSSQVKWPENNTDFSRVLMSMSWYFR